MKNSKDKYYRIEDQLPPKMKAEKGKQQNILWHNRKSTSTAERLVMSVKKGKLVINNETYRLKLRIPNAAVLLKLKEEEIAVLEEQDIRCGQEIIKEGSCFQGYVADVTNFEDINKAYEWVKFHNMAARHIICAYRLPGPNFPVLQDYYDDDEYGTGKVLLQYMMDAGIKNRVFFVTMRYDGTHIGVKHFNAIIDAAKSVTRSKPFNAVLNRFQFPWKHQGPRGGRGGMVIPLEHVDEMSSQESVTKILPSKTVTILLRIGLMTTTILTLKKELKALNIYSIVT